MTSVNETQPATAGNHRSMLRHPAVMAVQRQRAQNIQLRVADQITRFAGSMQFVYIHAVLFAIWMLWLERSPWPTLTLVVSLEAIFLSTFVMIGQNRQGEIAQAKADHDYRAQELELDHNTKVTELIHQLTKEIHAAVAAQGRAGQEDVESADAEVC
jgi:uncharacterized membrane protein